MQKLFSSVATGLKNTPSTVAFCPVKGTLQRPCQIIAIFHAAAFVSVVSALRVHFLTFIDNYPIFQ